MSIENQINIEGLKKGDRTEYKRLYELYYNELASYIFSLNKNKQEAEDIVQNVMLNIWRSKKTLEIKTSLKSYLYKACYYEYITHYNNAKKKSKYIEANKKNALAYFIEEDVDSIKQKIKYIHLEINRLPPKCKEIFILSKIQGLKYREIAASLNISTKTVENQISKALSRIKEGLKKQF